MNRPDADIPQVSPASDARTVQLEAMLEAAVSAILTIDDRGLIQTVNASAVRLLGFTREELLGQNVRLIMPEPYSAEHDRHIANYLHTGRKKIIGIGREMTARRKDGSTFPIHLAVSEFVVQGQRFFSGLITDLSEQKAAELALRDSERQLAQAHKMEAVGQLTGGIAHDFNNLLTVIIGNLELLDMRLDGEVERDLLRRAQEAAQMGARLTGRLMTFSRRGTLQAQAVNLNETTMGMTELLRRTLGENISVTTDLASDLWTTRVDPGEIENAVVNLAINARDAMPNGGHILIATANVAVGPHNQRLIPDLAPGDYVRLAVSDTGTGMTAEVAARAFEPFFTTKEVGRGTGLGLSTLYGFVKQSGGTATIASEVGKGTCVSFYLPRDRSGAGIRVPRSNLAEPQMPAAATRETILVVEDNAEVRELSVRRLTALGYQVFTAESGDAAVAAMERQTGIDLVFSDVVMPGGRSGYDVAAWVVANRPQTRVLLTSGFAPVHEAGEARREPPEGVRLLRKPYGQADLARAVRFALGRPR